VNAATVQHLLPLLLAYALIAFFLVAERLLRRGEHAQSFKSQPTDRGSTRFIGGAFGGSMLALMGAAFLGMETPGAFTSALAWVGVAIMALGLLLRIWSARTLGEFYTRTLLVSGRQQLVESGPYRWLRHPGYSGDIVLLLGAGVASGNVFVLAVIALMVLPAYAYRIHVEEIMLHQQFGATFERYAQTRWRVIPFLY